MKVTGPYNCAMRIEIESEQTCAIQAKSSVSALISRQRQGGIDMRYP